MTSNKKKALAAGGVGIVLAGWLGASIHAGSVAERELRAFAARPSSETGVRVRNLQHSGGLFASKVNPDVLRIVVVVLGLAISIAFFIKHY